MSDKPWERNDRPPRRTGPKQLAKDRPPQARQPGETLAAYRGFRSFLEHGSIRNAADALDMNRSVLERYSRRWRWTERKALILQNVAHSYDDLTTYEEKRKLPPAADIDELDRRQSAAFREVAGPRIDRDLQKLLNELLH